MDNTAIREWPVNRHSVGVPKTSGGMSMLGLAVDDAPIQCNMALVNKFTPQTARHRTAGLSKTGTEHVDSIEHKSVPGLGLFPRVCAEMSSAPFAAPLVAPPTTPPFRSPFPLVYLSRSEIAARSSALSSAAQPARNDPEASFTEPMAFDGDFEVTGSLPKSVETRPVPDQSDNSLSEAVPFQPPQCLSRRKRPPVTLITPSPPPKVPPKVSSDAQIDNTAMSLHWHSSSNKSKVPYCLLASEPGIAFADSHSKSLHIPDDEDEHHLAVHSPHADVQPLLSTFPMSTRLSQQGEARPWNTPRGSPCVVSSFLDLAAVRGQCKGSLKALRRCRARKWADLQKKRQAAQLLEHSKAAHAKARREYIERMATSTASRQAQLTAVQQAAKKSLELATEAEAEDAARCSLLSSGIVTDMESDQLHELVARVVQTANALCNDLRADMSGTPSQAGSNATCIMHLPLAARWCARYWAETGAMAPPVLAVYHGTRSEVVEAVCKEGLRLPDGNAVRYSTTLSMSHGSNARIFASLNFERALLHSSDHASVFLCLALPGQETLPCDHAQTTYMFSEESQLLPCHLLNSSAAAQCVAENALQIVHRILDTSFAN